MKKLGLLLFLLFIQGCYAQETLVSPSAQSSSSEAEIVTNKDSTEKSGRIIAFLPGWKTPPDARAIAHAGYTHIMIAFGVFNTAMPGEITPAFDAISADYIKSLQQAGIKVLLSLGGASTNKPLTTTNFHDVLSLSPSPTTFSQKFIASLENLIAIYGFDGIDMDIEHGLTGRGRFAQPTGDVAVLADIINTLHLKHPQLLLTLTPQTANIAATSGFDGTWANYAALVMQTYQSLAWVGIQMYNAGCSYGINLICYDPNQSNSPDATVAMATDLLENWPLTTTSGQPTGFQPYKSYLKPSQIVLGYPAINATGNSDGLPGAVVSTIKRAIQCLRTGIASQSSCDTYVPPRIYPEISGVFEWEITYDADNNYQFATGLKHCIFNHQC